MHFIQSWQLMRGVFRTIAPFLLFGACTSLTPLEDHPLSIQLSVSECTHSRHWTPLKDRPTPTDLARDAFCVEHLMKRYATQGVVTLFGSARTPETAVAYQQARQFAFLWTQKMGHRYPILTGGGGGIMEAGNRGAQEAHGRSLGLTTEFDTKGGESLNPYVTDGYRFVSFAQRESEMVDRAVAIVILPGGFGTEWELYETLSKIQTHHKDSVPVILLGSDDNRNSVNHRIDYLKQLKTISVKDDQLFQWIPTPEKAVQVIIQWLEQQSILLTSH